MRALIFPVSLVVAFAMYAAIGGAAGVFIQRHDPQCSWPDPTQVAISDFSVMRGAFWPVSVPWLWAQLAVGYRSPCAGETVEP